MSRPAQQIVAALLAAMPVLAALVLWGFAVPFRVNPPQTPPFAAAQAEAWADTFSAQFPDRALGTPGQLRATTYVVDYMQSLGVTPTVMPFSVTVGGQAQSASLIWAEFPGTQPEVVVLTAHRDTAFGNDNARGVAAALELARTRTTPFSLMVVIADAHYYGPASGARQFAETLQTIRLSRRVLAVLELTTDSPVLSVNAVGLRQNSAPVAVRVPADAALRVLGQPLYPDPVSEWVARALPYGISEASMYLSLGVPAVQLRGPLPQVGAAAQTWLATLPQTAPPALPTWPALRVGDAYVPDNVAGIASLLLFVPLFYATLITVRAHLTWGLFRLEMEAVLAWALIALNALAVPFILVGVGALPRYDMFPATPGDPFLTETAGWAQALMLGVGSVFAWLILGRRDSWGRLPNRLPIPWKARRATVLLVLSAACAWLWWLNPFGASLFLGPLAYLWIWVWPRAYLPNGRWLNVTLLGAGLVPFALLVVALNLMPGLGPSWWFLVLSAAYGLVPLGATVGVVAVWAALARLAWLGWLEGPAVG